MKYVLMRKATNPDFYEPAGDFDSLVDAVKEREANLNHGNGPCDIFQRVDIFEAYASAARQTTAPVYPAPDAAFLRPVNADGIIVNAAPPAKSRAEQELDKFEAHEVKG